ISEEPQDSVMSSDGEVTGMYSPPGRIASRIYKSTSTRRKSSAASSRLNSMSSHHSSRSARSAHGGPQSSHIAQHLRRASIIESRKAKAADRNAHAEKVRLRAAMNKAAPRTTTNSEERAIAAQQARERYLAQVKANCAEEVKRSKRVAEEQREKRAAEHLKLKEDVEERHAEAEKRKTLLQQSQRRARTTSLASVEEKKVVPYVWKPKNHDQAARIIQRAWQNWQRRVTIQDFLRLGLTVEAVQKTTFEDVGVLLNKENVLSCTAKMLKLCGLKNLGDDDAAEKAAVRTFLSTFLILGHPAQVLSKEGEQEQDLVDKAKGLLLHFDRIIDSSSDPRQSALSAQLAELSEAYASFQAAFAAWKAHDSSYLVSNMIAQFVELDAIWQTVKDDKDGAVAADYKEGIQQNQTLVLVRLKRLAGPDNAMKMIKQAIRARRKTSSKKDPAPDNKPRAAPVDQKDSSSVRVMPAVSTPSLAEPPFSVAKGDMRQKIGAPTLLPDNRHILHELAINKEFKVDLQPRIDIRDSLIDTVSRSMQQGLDAAEGENWIPAVAKMIYEKLLRLLTPGNSLHVLISETLDPTLIANQVKNGAFSYDKFFSFMNTILPKLCAPVRDQDVKDLAQNPSHDPIRQLARLYYIIDLLLFDHMNFMLQRFGPTLIDGSVEYEKRCFLTRLENQFPVKTLRWWRAAVAKTREEPSRRAVEENSNPAARVTVDRIYMHGLVDLAIRTNDLQDAEIPETLELDTDRLARIRSDILRLITVSSILLTAKNLLRRDVRSLWKLENQRMWDLPLSSSPAAFVSIVESRYALPPTTKQQLMGTITRLLTDARAGQVNHPVMKVLLKKIHAHVLARLAASSAEERIRTSTTASEVLGSSGMPESVSRIGDLVQELGRVADVDREAHGKWYDEVASRV
ncbi:T-complex protein 11-domain-containing protein, partial [Usnea florida]